MLEAVNSSKKQTNEFNLLSFASRKKLTPKRHFEINWPLEYINSATFVGNFWRHFHYFFNYKTHSIFFLTFQHVLFWHHILLTSQLLPYRLWLYAPWFLQLKWKCFCQYGGPRKLIWFPLLWHFYLDYLLVLKWEWLWVVVLIYVFWFTHQEPQKSAYQEEK